MAAKKDKVGNVPNLRFPGFEGEWETKKLGEAGIINPKNEDLPNSFIYIDLESVVNGCLLKEGRIVKDEAPSRAQRRLIRGDILFQMVRPYQKNNLFFDIEGDYVASTGYAQIRILKNPQFVFQYLHNQKFVDKVIERCTGTSYPAINSSDLGNISIHYPNSQEQNKIANFLELLDNRIQTQIKIIGNCKSQIKELSIKLFSQKLRFKNYNGNSFPEWSNLKGNEIFDNISNKQHNSDLPILAITQEHGAIPRNLIDYQISVTDKSIEGYKKVEKGDFIISLRSFQGGIEYSNYTGICSPAYIILRARMEIDSVFYRYYLRTEKYIKSLNKKLEGIRDGKMISYKNFSDITLLYPSVEEQIKISSFLSLLEKKVEQEKKLLRVLQNQKRYFLKSMFI